MPEAIASYQAQFDRVLDVLLPALLDEVEALTADKERLDYIERTFSGMTNRERYLPVQMIWGKGCNGRTLREACDKYMARDAARHEPKDAER